MAYPPAARAGRRPTGDRSAKVDPRRRRHRPHRRPDRPPDPREDRRAPPTPCCSASPPAGVPLARRLAARIRAFEGVDVPGRRARHHPLPRRPAPARRPRARPDRAAARRHRRPAGDPRRRRALLRPHRPGRPRRAQPTSAGPAPVQLAVLVDRGHRRAADPRRLRRQEHPDRAAPRASGCCSPRPTARDEVRLHRAKGGNGAMIRHLLSAADLDAATATAGPRHRHRDGRDRRPRGQEAADAARPHRGEPLLRGLHPDPDLVRGGRQAAVAPT